MLDQSAAQPGHQGLVQGIESAQQRPAQQHGGAERQFEQAEARLCDGVVGSLLVGSKGDLFRERRGNGVAVMGHMANLA